MQKILFLLTILVGLTYVAEANVTLPSVIGSNMVLQRNTDVNLW